MAVNEGDALFGSQAIQLYVAYMEEIKLRSRAITEACQRAAADPVAPGAFVHAESGFLQLRFICELVALASLAAHHSIGLGSKLAKQWQADLAFSMLEQVNPACFPVAVGRIPEPNGRGNFQIVQRRADFTRAQLAQVYGACGDALHRGAIKAHIAGKRRQYDLGKLNSWHRTMMGLLSQHMVMIRDPDRVVLVNMRRLGEDVEVFAAGAVESEELPDHARQAFDLK